MGTRDGRRDLGKPGPRERTSVKDVDNTIRRRTFVSSEKPISNETCASLGKNTWNTKYGCRKPKPAAGTPPTWPLPGALLGNASRWPPTPANTYTYPLTSLAHTRCTAFGAGETEQLESGSLPC